MSVTEKRPPAKAAKRGVSWTLINFYLDASLLVAFVVLLWSSLVLHFVFPPAIQAQGWMLWGWTYGQWAGLQLSTLGVLTAGILLHVMLHWSWVCGVVANKFLPRRPRPDEGTRTLLGVGLLIAILILVGLALAVAELSVVDTVNQPK